MLFYYDNSCLAETLYNYIISSGLIMSSVVHSNYYLMAGVDQQFLDLLANVQECIRTRVLAMLIPERYVATV